MSVDGSAPWTIGDQNTDDGTLRFQVKPHLHLCGSKYGMMGIESGATTSRSHEDCRTRRCTDRFHGDDQMPFFTFCAGRVVFGMGGR